jgi:hypothetical protein
MGRLGRQHHHPGERLQRRHAGVHPAGGNHHHDECAHGRTGHRGGVAPGQSTRWRQQITAWCSTCHSRYNTQQPGAGSTAVTTTNPADNTSTNLPGGVLGGPFANGGSYNTDSGDAIYKFRHGTQNRQCTMCHVAHGSDAVMDTDPTTTGAQGFAGNYPYPDSTPSASSRLLKVNNRGTCQQCHDPTGTITWNSAPITH